LGGEVVDHLVVHSGIGSRRRAHPRVTATAQRVTGVRMPRADVLAVCGMGGRRAASPTRGVLPTVAALGGRVASRSRVPSAVKSRAATTTSAGATAVGLRGSVGGGTSTAQRSRGVESEVLGDCREGGEEDGNVSEGDVAAELVVTGPCRERAVGVRVDTGEDALSVLCCGRLDAGADSVSSWWMPWWPAMKAVIPAVDGRRRSAAEVILVTSSSSGGAWAAIDVKSANDEGAHRACAWWEASREPVMASWRLMS
jgi:hypothetical protein